MLDVNNFRDFSAEEYNENLLRLRVNSHSSLVGEMVYYVKPSYGEHKVISWDPDNCRFLLELCSDGAKFFSNPFQLIRID